MRTLAIGDIHGCITALSTLLHAVRLAPNDRLVLLGDYVDRGPASRQVIDALLEIGNYCPAVFIRGNHEEMLLDARLGTVDSLSWLEYEGKSTLASYGVLEPGNWDARIPGSHWEFFEKTVPYHETDTHIFVHANLEPDLDMKDQPEYMLRWEYFDKLTKPHKSGKRVICGHSAQRSGKINDVGHAVCIDTAAAVGGWLTCLDVTSGKYWQANEKGHTREGWLSEQAVPKIR